MRGRGMKCEGEGWNVDEMGGRGMKCEAEGWNEKMRRHVETGSWVGG